MPGPIIACDRARMDLTAVAPEFVEMAHRIVWCSTATVDGRGRPRSRILHPVWDWDGTQLTGWIATSPTPIKRAHLEAHPYASLTYWAPNHDTCTAECGAELVYDDDTRIQVWERFVSAPEPVYTGSATLQSFESGPELIAHIDKATQAARHR